MGRQSVLKLLGLVLVVTPAICAWAEAEGAPPIIHIPQMHQHPFFVDVMASSVVGWVLGRVRGFSGIQDWLGRYWKDVPRFIIFLGDVCVFVAVGAYFGTAIYDPKSLWAAIAAGLSWPIGLGALATRD
jgi:hypothetical protein